jgi:hypothetical protein
VNPFLFNNPAFANMSPEKQQFLLAFADKEKPVSMKDAMPFLLANMRQAKQQNLDFTKPEVQLMCELLSKDLPPAQQEQIKKLMAML